MRAFLDSLEKHFKAGGRLERLYPLYEGGRHLSLHARLDDARCVARPGRPST